MLRKTLEEVFIFKKPTQCKTSHTIETDFDLPDTRNIEKLFSKYEMFFLDQLNFSSDLSKILIMQQLIPRAASSPWPSLFNLTLVKWKSSSAYLYHALILPYPVRPNTTSIGYTKSYAKPRQSNFFIKLYTNHKYFFVKHTRHTTKSPDFKSRFSFKVRKYGQQQLYFQYEVCWIFYKMKGAHSFPLPYICIQPLLQTPPQIRSPTSATFHLPIFALLLHNISAKIKITNTPFLCTSAIFHFPIFVHRNPYNLQKSILPISII